MRIEEVAEQTFQPAALNLGEGRPMPNYDHFIYKVASEDSAGRFALLQGGLPPRVLIPPHIHTREDEMTIVIRGRLGAWVGDKEFELGPGGVVLKPRNIVHAMWNPTDEASVLLEYISPGAYVRFFEEVAALPGKWVGDRRVLSELAASYGQRWVETEWLAEVVKRYGLRAW
jgi:quercetin dioxygenase-like cupin family protein